MNYFYLMRDGVNGYYSMTRPTSDLRARFLRSGKDIAVLSCATRFRIERDSVQVSSPTVTRVVLSARDIKAAGDAKDLELIAGVCD